MSKIYAMTDIHGYLEILKITMEKVDLCDDNKLILLGDYIDGGSSSRETLEYIFNLQRKYPNNVIALKGNHEDMFLKWIYDNDYIDYLQSDYNLNTIKTFLTTKQLTEITELCNGSNNQTVFDINSIVVRCVKKNNAELIKWLKELPLYYETEKQIFVHAGVDEEAGEYWKYGTEDYYYMWKYPHTTGKFYKDIIAGHIGVSEIAGDKNFHDIYFDGDNHYYIDSTVEINRKLNLLVYDTETDEYTFM